MEEEARQVGHLVGFAERLLDILNDVAGRDVALPEVLLEPALTAGHQGPREVGVGLNDRERMASSSEGVPKA